MSRHSRSRLVVVILTLAIVWTGVAIWSAARTIGTRFPALLVEPTGVFSELCLPSWHTDELPIRDPDQLVAVDGVSVDPARMRYGDSPAGRLRARIEQLARAGIGHVHLTFLHGGREITVDRPIRSIGPEELLLLFGMYAAVGWLVLWSGLVVLLLAERRSGAAAYAFFAVGIFVHLLTLFDFHTRARFEPVFTISMVWTSLAALWVAYAFPEPPRYRRNALRACMLVLSAFAIAVAVWLAVAPVIGADTRGLRHLLMQAVTRSSALLALAVLVRLRGTTGRERAEIRSAIGGLLLAPALVVVGLIHGGALFYLVLPFLIGLLPLSIGNALIRHNILATTALLTRRLFVAPTLLVAFAGSVFAWRIADGVVARGDASVLVAVAVGVVFLALFWLTRRLWVRWFFPAAARFRPTIEQLSDELTSPRDLAALRRGIEDVVRRWLPTREVHVLDEGELGRIQRLSADTRERLRNGERVWTLEHPWERQLLVPMRSLGELRAVLQVAPKHQAALYTSEDMVLLETIAGFGAVALHNLEVAAQLAALRRSELDAARDDKRLALGLIGAEVSHEIAYSLNFFRYLLRTGVGSSALAEQDLEIGREEVERLQRMLSALRKLQASTPQLQPVQLQRPLARAIDLLRESIDAGRVRLALEVPSDLTVVADADSLVQLFANLLRNALQAAGAGGEIGVRSLVGSEGLVVEVWDSGPGIPDDIKSSIFNHWVTSKKDGSGLGLAISQRIVRSLNWTLEVDRVDGRTSFCIRIPAASAAATKEAQSAGSR